jgi:hypothetical protein
MAAQHRSNQQQRCAPSLLPLMCLCPSVSLPCVLNVVSWSILDVFVRSESVVRPTAAALVPFTGQDRTRCDNRQQQQQQQRIPAHLTSGAARAAAVSRLQQRSVRLLLVVVSLQHLAVRLCLTQRLSSRSPHRSPAFPAFALVLVFFSHWQPIAQTAVDSDLVIASIPRLDSDFTASRQPAVPTSHHHCSISH